MSKLNNYIGSVDLISGLRPKNNRDFPLMEAHDIVVDEEGTRLDEKLEALSNGESGEVANVYSLSIYKSTNTTPDINKWEIIEGTPLHKYKFVINLPHPVISNDYLYLSDSIVLDTTEDIGAQKTIFKTAQSVSGKKFTIYSDLDVDCKIILKGY